MTDRNLASVPESFERALGEIQTRVCTFGESTGADQSMASQSGMIRPAIAIAYSGGLDSSVLLHLASDYAKARNIVLHAFHIHHGISPNADSWLTHCERECARLGIAFDARRITLANQDKSGTEEAARISRYAALGDLCRHYRVPLLLTAHHQDDQAETVLLQLLRGSGVAGLSGMDTANAAPDLLGNASLVMARPLLTASRAELADFAQAKQIAFIEDESNADPRYARNALRQQLMPLLEKKFPGFQGRFARSAQHAQSAQRLLIELAAQDLAGCLDGECIDINQLKRLNSDRIDNLLRYWFGSRGVRMPSTAWLSEMRTQLLEAKADAQLCVTHADCHIRRHRDRVFLTPKMKFDPASISPLAFNWNGESQMRFAAFGGVLHFDKGEQGVDADWLRSQSLTIRYRHGGERLKPAANRPTKSLKYHYQALDVPAWEREYLPLILAEKHLLFAAGIGMDCHHLSSNDGVRIQFRWQPDSF